MDPELFRKKLEQFAELKQIKVPKSGNLRESDEPEIISRGGVDFTIDVDNNPTVGWGIKKLKPHIALCESCREVVENRVVETKKYESPNLHWRSHCKPCGRVQNPYTKQFDLTVKQSFHSYASFQKGLPQPYLENEAEEKSHLKPVFKKPAK